MDVGCACLAASQNYSLEAFENNNLPKENAGSQGHGTKNNLQDLSMESMGIWEIMGVWESLGAPSMLPIDGLAFKLL